MFVYCIYIFLFVSKGVDETSAENGCDRLVTLSGSLMTNASHSLSSSNFNWTPRSSASINSSSLTSQPELPRIKDEAALARFFSGLENAFQSQFQHSIRSPQPPQLQAQFMGSSRPLVQWPVCKRSSCNFMLM